jgi:hypothetical protein
LVGDGLGRRAFRRRIVHAGTSSHQFRNHAAVPAASLRKEETMNKMNLMKSRLALLVLLGSMVVVPVAQAQIKHIEMRVEGMT